MEGQLQFIHSGKNLYEYVCQSNLTNRSQVVQEQIRVLLTIFSQSLQSELQRVTAG